MKYFPLALALLCLLLLLLTPGKANASNTPSCQPIPVTVKKTEPKKASTTSKTGVIVTKKQPSSSIQPLLIDRIFEQQRN